MEVLRGWLSNSGYNPDSVNLQTLSQSLQDTVSQIRRTAGVADADAACHRHGRVTGDHQFHFDLHFEPRSEGGGLCQTGVLVAAATTKSDGGGQPVPITCAWKRRFGAHVIDIPGIRGSMYHASADDIGMDVLCEAEPPNSSDGKASGVLGPFELDPITRLSLENLISSGGSRFPVRHFRNTEDTLPRDLQIHVTQDYVKVVHPGAERGSETLIQYTADHPRIVIHPLDTCKFRLELSDREEDAYHFVALSRTSRDLIALLVRCFHSRRYIATSLILGSLGQNPATPGAPLTSLSKDRFDIHTLIACLGKELNRNVGMLSRVDRKVKNATAEKHELQAQLRETITSYTEAIEKVHQQLSKAGPDAALQWKLHDAKATQGKFQLELAELTQRIADEFPDGLGQIANDREAEANAEEEALKAEVEEMRKKILSLAGESVTNAKVDNTRVAELTRLRRDVDMLNGEKEALERNKLEADQEKQALIDNFLCVKKDLDRLQMASLDSTANPELERQLVALRREHDEALEERNRVAARLEAIDRDREKQKQQREAALERVMAQNSKLVEEKDRIDREKARISGLYQETMGAMGALPEANPSAPASAPEGGDAGEAGTVASAAELQEELRQKTELLQKREQESESLRSRLRKLAMV